MRAVVVGLALVASAAWAETWADEPEAAPSAPLPKPPPFGLTAGVHLLTGISAIGPVPGARLGLRVRLGQHAALTALALYEVAWTTTLQATGPGLRSPSVEVVSWAHAIQGVLRLEGFSVSAFERLLVPEFSVGLFAGAGVDVEPTFVAPVFLFGLHLGMTRLRPSGWWFPVFVEAGVQFFADQGRVSDALWRLSVGVGI